MQFLSPLHTSLRQRQLAKKEKVAKARDWANFSGLRSPMLLTGKLLLATFP